MNNSTQVLLAFACLLLGAAGGCAGNGSKTGTESRLSIDRAAPAIETKTYDAGSPLKKGTKEEANTKWFFHCQTGFDGVVKENATDRGASVLLTVEAVRVGLTLPITVYMPEDAEPKLKEHELGHVEICKRIYDEAESISRDCSSQVIARGFTGEGATLKQARRKAEQEAGKVFCHCYGKKTVDKANAISEIYDSITDHSHNDIAATTAVDEAFARYSE